jgi:hypothetical protein
MMKDCDMCKDTMDSSWLDEFDPEMSACLQCDVELDVKGLTYREVLPIIATALRGVADEIEKGRLDTGFHKLRSDDETDVGEVYLDYYGESSF